MSNRLRVLILVGVFLAETRLFAQVNSAMAGGTGGSASSLQCDGGEVLIGIKGRAGAYVDQIRGICGKVNQILMTEDEHDTESEGGNGGQTFRTQQCPSGWAVRGLRVRAGSYVDAVKIRCGRLQRTGLVSSTRTHPIFAGGSGGSATTLTCPDNLPADRIRVRSASWIDRIGLRCDADTVPAITPADPNLPDLRVAIRDYPSIVTNIDRFTWRVEVWNVGAPAPNGVTVDITVPGAANATFEQHPSFATPVTCNTTPTGARCTAGAPIPTGARMVVRVRMTPESGSDEVEVSAEADQPGQIQEISNTNNSDRRSLTRVLVL